MSDASQTTPQAPKGRLRHGHRGGGHIRTIFALMLREMSTRYGRSPGGYAWAIVEPLGFIIVLALAFGLILRAPPLGTSFLIFFATGFLVYDMFLSLSNKVGQSLTFSLALLRYPAVSWFDAVSARVILNALTGMLVSYLILVGVILIEDTAIVLDFGAIVVAYGLAIALGTGAGLVNCAISGFFPVWQTLWSIFTRPLFLASGIFFLYEDLPTGARDILWYNPLIHITSIMRSGFYAMYEPQFVSIPFVLGLALALTALGLLLNRRYHQEIMELLRN